MKGKIINGIANAAAAIWFFGVVLGTLLFMTLGVFMCAGNIDNMMKSGFADRPFGLIVLFMTGLVFSITMLIPAFRRCFRVLPWLYPYMTVWMADLLILSVAENLVSCGYEVQSTVRQGIFMLLMVIVMIGGRLVMCLYFHKKPAKIEGEEYERQESNERGRL